MGPRPLSPMRTSAVTILLPQGDQCSFRELNLRMSHYCPAVRPSLPVLPAWYTLIQLHQIEKTVKSRRIGFCPGCLIKFFKMKTISFGSSFVKKEGAGERKADFLRSICFAQ